MSDLEMGRRALAIFDAVAELDPAQRANALESMCAGDDALRARVQALLDADAHATEPFAGDASAWGSALANDHPDADADHAIGRSIGAWKIVGTIGRGGMGAVHAVERSDGAYTQQAALKLIRAAPIRRSRANVSCANGRSWLACSIPTSPPCWMAASARMASPTS